MSRIGLSDSGCGERRSRRVGDGGGVGSVHVISEHLYLQLLSDDIRPAYCHQISYISLSLLNLAKREPCEINELVSDARSVYKSPRNPESTSQHDRGPSFDMLYHSLLILAVLLQFDLASSSLLPNKSKTHAF